MTASASPSIEFDQVGLHAISGAGGTPLSFRLDPGRVLWLETGPEQVEHLGDVLLGLEIPDAGRVLIRGRDWQQLDADAQAAERAAIRRIFSHKGWISHLDMKENYILSRFHHGEGAESTLLEDCQTVSRDLGLELLTGFPETIHPLRLHPMQWVRALTGRANLLVIGCRAELFPPGLDGRLAAVLTRRIQEGLSVIWLGPAVPDRLWGVPDPELCVKVSLTW